MAPLGFEPRGLAPHDENANNACEVNLPFAATIGMPRDLTVIIWPVLTTVVAVGLLALLLLGLRSWMSDNEDPTASDHELLSRYREMQRRGELSDEEFRLIKGQLVVRMSVTPRRIADAAGGVVDEPPKRESK